MAGSNLGIGLGERSLSLFPSRPSSGLGLETTSFALKTYTADRFAVAQGIGGSGSYIYELPDGMDDNDLFNIEADTGVLSAPHPILETDVTKNILVRMTDQSTGASVDAPATVSVTGTIHRWNVATLSSNPGGLPNWVAGTDNSSQMDALRSRLLAEQTADQGCAFEVTIPAGQYDHRRPQTFRGIRRYRLIGAGKSATGGTRLRNTSNSGNWYNAIHFLTNFDPYQRTGGSGGAGPEHYGFLIDTAIAGSIQVKLKQAVDSPRLGGVGLGRRVWIASGIASAYPGSYPPHNKYFEPAIITVYSGTGVGATITLDRPLRHTHDADAPEVSSSIAFGRARIVFGDQDYSASGGVWYPGSEVVVLEGIRFLPNPNWSVVAAPQIDSEQVQVFGAQYARLENLYMSSWGPQISEKQVLRNVDVAGSSEPDAQIWEVVIEDSDIGHIGGPNGPTNMTVRRTRFREDIRLGMGRFVCDDCDFTKWQNGGGYWTLFTMDHLGPTTELKITNSRFWANGSGSRTVFGGSPYRDATVGTDIAYAAGSPAVATVAYPGGNPDSTLWSWLTTQVGDQGDGRAMYMQGVTPRWGTILSTRAAAGPNSASLLEIAWDSGAGGGITNGTVMRFYKIRDLVFQNVTFNGWTNEGQLGGGQAHNCANHQAYTLAGQSIPRTVWNVTIAP